MTIERSHGKARPTLPRSSDLPEVPTDRERAAERLPGGQFAAGNTLARGRGWKTSVRKMLGNVDGADGVAVEVANDAWRIFCANVRELPNDGSIVRGLLMRKARHEALGAFWEREASRVGLTSEAGVRAQAEASKHGQRAERLIVTAVDVASRLAAKRPEGADDLPWLEASK